MKAMTKFLALGVAAALPLIQACGSGAAWEGTVTDSAGVAIVNNTPTPLWHAGDEWTATENLRIGTVAGEPEYQFGQLGFVDVAPDGTIYALDAQTQEVKAFDAQGGLFENRRRTRWRTRRARPRSCLRLRGSRRRTGGSRPRECQGQSVRPGWGTGRELPTSAPGRRANPLGPG